MELSKQSTSRLEETKVEKRNEDQEYLQSHPEIGAAFRMLSKVNEATKIRIFFFEFFLDPDEGAASQRLQTTP